MNDQLDKWLNKNVADSTPSPKPASPKPPAPTTSKTNHVPAKKTPHSHPSTVKTTHTPVKKHPAPAHKPKQPRPTVGSQQKGPARKLPFDLNDGKVRYIPLGGMEEVGRNMAACFYKNDIVLVDCGLQFPEADMFGIDYVVPDVSMLEPLKDKIRGIVITHGHLDHIGALPHILPKLGFPTLYGTPLTLGLARKRLEEYALVEKTTFRIIDPAKDKIQLGQIGVEFFRVNHSIPDGVGLALVTPNGIITHTGDFKFDFTPADGIPADFGKIAELGKRGVTLAFADSTNAEKPGYTISESVIAKNLAATIEKAKGRIIVATFSSLIGRIQHILSAAVKTNRKVFVSGRSMIQNIEMAVKLGYLKVPQGLLRQLKKGTDISKLPPNKMMILCTGSQGEELSALTRIGLGEHSTIKIKDGDTVVFSSTPIIGNERAVVSVMNNLLRLGANVITNKHLDVHTSGHASQEDLKLMHSLLRPKHLVPVHGELHMRSAHKILANGIGIPENNVLLLDNGDIVELAPGGIVRKSKTKIRIDNIMIDGLGVGDIGTQVIRERAIMSENGVVLLIFKAYASSGKLVGDPDIVSRGFIYMKESNAIVEETKKVAKKAYEESITAGQKDYKEVRFAVIKAVERFIRQRIDREPLVLPFTVKI